MILSYPPKIALNPDASSAKTLLELYQVEFDTFGRFAKDFVRTMVFPKISHLVPSATREGAEAFLKRMRYKRDVFELGSSDLGSLSEIWGDVLAGHLSVQEGARRSQIVAQRSYQVVDRSPP